MDADDVLQILDVLAQAIEAWAVDLPDGLYEHFDDSFDSRNQRAMCSDTQFRPGFLTPPFLGEMEAFDYVALAIGPTQAEALGQRLTSLEKCRTHLADAVTELAARWDNAKCMESFAHLEELGSWLQREAFQTCAFIRTLSRLAASGTVGSLKPGTPAGVSPVKAGADKVTIWREVQERLLRLYERGEPYTDLSEFAERMGCSRHTIYKAINDSPRLKGWQVRHLEVKRTPRARSLTPVDTDNVEQRHEIDPALAAETDDVDFVFAKLIQEAQPEERARLHALNDEEREKLVGLIRNDHDSYDRILGRKP